jgi:SHAQKYF class myb-like DNA-binding protein|uniref:HTH myb-type domain-containing protein n=1 Tax=Calcidiscus leptoporus TaxID=127549 RepID=A0A7S0NZN8_9EUKA|mmetsp:Transcript_44620/g.104226  ORF Transcript_44620/g.104226 Transcript_44620/m.104226 type:complete len:261 (+) Transcript_44620:87-869(+)
MQAPQQQPAQGPPPPFCGVPGAELAAMAQAAWGQMDNIGAPSASALAGPLAQPGAMPEQPSISLSAQAELELELSLRGSLLVQQQRRIVQLEDELQRAWAEIDRLRTKMAAVERERQRSEDDSQKQPRYWTPEEHRLFMEAVQRYGWKDVKSIAQHVGTRTPTQVRTHAQKLFLRQQKEQTGLMQPTKNGRTDMPLGLPAPADGSIGTALAIPEGMMGDHGMMDGDSMHALDPATAISLGEAMAAEGAGADIAEAHKIEG